MFRNKPFEGKIWENKLNVYLQHWNMFQYKKIQIKSLGVQYCVVLTHRMQVCDWIFRDILPIFVLNTIPIIIEILYVI